MERLLISVIHFCVLLTTFYFTDVSVRDYEQYLFTALTDTLEKKNTDYKALQTKQEKLKVRIYVLFTL
jgi:hypothetical protein